LSGTERLDIAAKMGNFLVYTAAITVSMRVTHIFT
jgi:hypothetical protein